MVPIARLVFTRPGSNALRFRGRRPECYSGSEDRQTARRSSPTACAQARGVGPVIGLRGTDTDRMDYRHPNDGHADGYHQGPLTDRTRELRRVERRHATARSASARIFLQARASSPAIARPLPRSVPRAQHAAIARNASFRCSSRAAIAGQIVRLRFSPALLSSDLLPPGR